MKTAVILAGRRERDNSIPWPLEEFAPGKTLLGRTLSLLREYAYERLVIVGGFRAELLAPYKDDDVEIVMNPDFEFTSSMGSLALCEDLIDSDFLLVEGDTFFEKSLIDKLSEVKEGNMLAITEESGSGDECYVETMRGYVLAITKDRHRIKRFEGELIGVSRISLETFRRMLQLWKESSNPFLNYEYLLMDVTQPLERPCLKMKNLIWGDVDCKGDFVRLSNSIYRALRRKENPFDCENLMQHLREIFPGKDLSGMKIEQIGGMSNKNFKVTIGDEKYVLRVPGNGSEGMVERVNEEFNAARSCELGVNPEIRYFNPHSGVKLADFVEDAETLNAATIQRPENMRKIAEIYRTIHNSHIRLKNEFNIFQELSKYEGLLENAGGSMYPGWEDMRGKVIALEDRLNELGVDLVACHNDALYENFLKAPDGRIYLIDWEYSGMNDPMADLAALFLEADFEKENEDYFLSRYFPQGIPEVTEEKILIYQILWDALWSVWTCIKEAKGDDFGSYGIDRFRRAERNLSKLEGLKGN